MRNISDILPDASVRKAEDNSLDISITKSHADFEFLISRWSTETHSFITSFWSLYQTLENGSVMFWPPVLADKGVLDLALLEGEKENMKILNPALRLSSKSMYTWWARSWYF